MNNSSRFTNLSHFIKNFPNSLFGHDNRVAWLWWIWILQRIVFLKIYSTSFFLECFHNFTGHRDSNFLVVGYDLFFSDAVRAYYIKYRIVMPVWNVVRFLERYMNLEDQFALCLLIFIWILKIGSHFASSHLRSRFQERVPLNADFKTFIDSKRLLPS